MQADWCVSSDAGTISEINNPSRRDKVKELHVFRQTGRGTRPAGKGMIANGWRRREVATFAWP